MIFFSSLLTSDETLLICMSENETSRRAVDRTGSQVNEWDDADNADRQRKRCFSFLSEFCDCLWDQSWADCCTRKLSTLSGNLKECEWFPVKIFERERRNESHLASYKMRECEVKERWQAGNLCSSGGKLLECEKWDKWSRKKDTSNACTEVWKRLI